VPARVEARVLGRRMLRPLLGWPDGARSVIGRLLDHVPGADAKTAANRR